MKKLILFILPVLFLGGCSSEDGPTEDKPQNITGKYDTKYIDGKEYIQTFGLDWYDIKYLKDPFDTFYEVSLFSIDGRASIFSLKFYQNEKKNENDDFFLKSKELSPPVELLHEILELNEGPIISTPNRDIYFRTDTKYKYFLVADMQFTAIVPSLSYPAFKTDIMNVKRLTEWKIVEGEIDSYIISGMDWIKLIIKDDYVYK